MNNTNTVNNIIPFSESIPAEVYSPEEIKLILMGHFMETQDICVSDDSILIRADFDPATGSVEIFTKDNPNKPYVQNS